MIEKTVLKHFNTQVVPDLTNVHPESNLATYQMMFLPKEDVYERYPDTLGIALTMIGGFIALLKVAQLLRFFHQ